ncbi:MAG: fumarate hydratase [Christensenellaceae bacterium]|jgi:fumarate hydratase subunit alpha|nr:fumarate hydratase [Christensenellaceae bacterium]
MTREIDVALIEQAVRDLYIEACLYASDDLRAAVQAVRAKENKPVAREVLSQILQNMDLAAENGLPTCQDTGLCVVFLDLGQDVHLVGGDLNEAVDAGVRRACLEGRLRASSLTPLTRQNTKDNTPAVLHLRLVPGDLVHLSVAPKGFGSENMSRLKMLNPSDGEEGVKDFIVETMRIAGGKPCPPVILGVGIGGTAESCALLAKRMLLRPLGQKAEDPRLARMEEEVLARINALGIGPMGLGGGTTALAVHIAELPTHIAGLPVMVNMQCHASRHRETTI